MSASASVVEQVRHVSHCFLPATMNCLCQPNMNLSHASCLQAQAARAAAVAEVQRLLATADDLKRLTALREDVAAKQQVGFACLPAAAVLLNLTLAPRQLGSAAAAQHPPARRSPSPLAPGQQGAAERGGGQPGGGHQGGAGQPGQSAPGGHCSRAAAA